MKDHKTGLAFTSLFLGFLSLVPIAGLVASLLGIITGHIARSRAYHFPYQYGGDGVAFWGLFFSYFSLIIFLIVFSGALYLYNNDDLIPLIDVFDNTGMISGYVKQAIRWIPFM